MKPRIDIGLTQWPVLILLAAGGWGVLYTVWRLGVDMAELLLQLSWPV